MKIYLFETDCRKGILLSDSIYWIEDESEIEEFHKETDFSNWQGEHSITDKEREKIIKELTEKDEIVEEKEEEETEEESIDFSQFDLIIEKEIKFQLQEVGFFDESDNVERFSMHLADSIIATILIKAEEDNDEIEEEDIRENLISYIEEWIKDCEWLKGVSTTHERGDYTCYYFSSDLALETVKECENYFHIGE